MKEAKEMTYLEQIEAIEKHIKELLSENKRLKDIVDGLPKLEELAHMFPTELPKYKSFIIAQKIIDRIHQVTKDSKER